MNNKYIHQYNNNGRRHGYHNDSLWYKCFYHNGNLIGYEEHHPLLINKVVKTFYII